jgi:hypothetical protein
MEDALRLSDALTSLQENELPNEALHSDAVNCACER